MTTIFAGSSPAATSLLLANSLGATKSVTQRSKVRCASLVRGRLGPHRRLHARAPVAAVAHRVPRPRGDAILAGPPLAQEGAVRAEEPVVVERLHHRDAAGVEQLVHGGREQRKEVVHVGHVDRMRVEERRDAARGLGAAARAQARAQPARERVELRVAIVDA